MTGNTQSEKILDEVKRRKSRQIVDVEEEKVKLVFFSIGEDFYAFYGDAVKEILPAGKINYVPNAPAYMLGVINVRGDIESVIDIGGFLQLPGQTATAKSRIVIGERDGVRSGVIVASVADVWDVPKSALKPPMSALSENVKQFVVGQVDYKSRNATLLNLGTIFKKIAAG